MSLFARGMSVFIVSNRTYSMLIIPSVKSNTWKNFPSKFAFSGHSIINVCFSHSGNRIKNKDTEQFLPFDDLFKQKQDEARRSILVQLTESNGITELYDYCSTFGTVNSMFCCGTSNEKKRQVLVEFKNVETVDAILKYTTHEKSNSLIPVKSSFMFFRNRKKSSIYKSNVVPTKHMKMYPTEKKFLHEMQFSSTVNRQINTCHSLLKLDDLNLRLRFLIAYQLERSLSGLFPDIEALPFGSSVNGFGTVGCDLDLYMSFQRKLKDDSRSRFVFHSKFFDSSRDISSNYVRTIGDLINIFVPGAHNVVKISNARVPIIKFNHKITEIECDISFSNMSAVYMSELLYIYGGLNSIVRPLTFTIRLWAQKQNITRDNPGGQITNFSLTLMIIFYLQTKKVLPSLNELRQRASLEDLRMTDSLVDCTFLRNISNIQMNLNVQETPLSLLQGFFNYYASFDFKETMICLREGTELNCKKNFAPIHIRNPLEQTLNVSRNVTIQEMERFRFKCRAAALALENASEISRNEPWGIMNLFQNNSVPLSKLMDDSSIDEENSNALLASK